MIDLLLSRAQAAGIPLTREHAGRFEAYYHRVLMFTEANTRFNLTRAMMLRRGSRGLSAEGKGIADD